MATVSPFPEPLAVVVTVLAVAGMAGGCVAEWRESRSRPAVPQHAGRHRRRSTAGHRR